MSRMTTVRVNPNHPDLGEGSVGVTSTGYMLLGNDECVTFYFDVSERAYVSCSSSSDDDCPIVWLVGGGDEEAPWTEVVFPEYPGWRYHSSSGGKSIGIALVNRAKEFIDPIY